MGLTSQSTGLGALSKSFKASQSTNEKVIALAGNPNVGKSTVFNNLTGLNQHTGNWPGKTVTNAHGKYRHRDMDFILVDIPGTYSLMSNSQEEEIARDFICFGNPDATVIVTDATCLERNLNLVLQTLEITHNAVVCVNLLDEAKKKKISIDLKALSKQLGIPVIGTSARSGKGLHDLMEAVYNLTNNSHISTVTSPLAITYSDEIEEAIHLIEPTIHAHVKDQINSRWISLKLLDGDETIFQALQEYLECDMKAIENLDSKITDAKKQLAANHIDQDRFRDQIVSQIVTTSQTIAEQSITFDNKKYNENDRNIDRYLTSRIFGIPIMIALLGFIFWLTIIGANVPSSLLSNALFWIEARLTEFFIWIGTPSWVHGILVLGIYRTLAWVVSVMLPPMAIFFPLFTLLEDFGYLPRIAFNLDNFFKKACSHGKQALTMCMGFGCNAAGIIGCRIIDSPREKLIAMITNNFVPCNGRFPTLIVIITMFFAGFVAGPMQSVVSTILLTGIIVLGVVMTLVISKLLSKTILKGLPSSFTLELPPYRKPQIGKVIVRSILDRTLFVLGRAVLIAAPAGLVIWIMANIQIDQLSLLTHCAQFLNPFAKLFGLDGYILMAFILGFPANEIVIPIMIMSYMATGKITELDNINELRTLLISNGWTWLTALCTMLFSLMHWPCGTTCLTIRKESKSVKWTLISILIPTITGLTLCFIVANTVRLLGFI